MAARRPIHEPTSQAPSIAGARQPPELSGVMDTSHVHGTANGCEPVVEEEERRRLLWLMAEYFRTLGASDIKARLPGFVPPPVLSGTIEDHRPDFTCRQNDSQKTPVIVEVVTPDTVEDPNADNRWSLLASAAKLYNAELHFVVPKWTHVGAIDPVLKRRLARLELTVNRVWTV